MARRKFPYPGHSSGLNRRADEVQRSGPFREFCARYEGGSPGGDCFPLTSSEGEQVDPNARYCTGDGITVEGFELASGAVPVNLRRVNNKERE